MLKTFCKLAYAVAAKPQGNIFKVFEEVAEMETLLTQPA
jgi:hypothetical protein